MGQPVITKRNMHIFWVCPSSDLFYRVKGEIRSRPSSVVPKLIEKGYRLTILVPYDPTLLPKSKLSPGRIQRTDIHLSQNHAVEFIKLTRTDQSLAVYMLKTKPLDPSLKSAVLSKAALGLARLLNKPIDVFHVFGWEAALLPLFLELERAESKSRALDQARTFLNVSNLKNMGSFSPEVLSFLGLPKKLFHPEALEYYGQVSYLKTGLLFSDGIGLIEGDGRALAAASNNGLGGLLNVVSPKLRRWASPRSFKAHVEAYQELVRFPKPTPLLPQIIQKIDSASKPKSFDTFWGPVPPDRYHVNMLSFLVQSPVKAFVFWEWTKTNYASLGLVLHDETTGQQRELASNLSAVGEYWLDVESDHHYVVELVGWTPDGRRETLLRSRRVRTPRSHPSPNRQAVFIDVRSRRRFGLSGYLEWDELMKWLGSSRMAVLNAGFTLDVPSSWKQKATV